MTDYTLIARQDTRMKKHSIIFRFLQILLMFTVLPCFAGSLRTDTDWLSQNLATPTLVILDARSEEDFLAGHIPGAVHFPDSLTYQDQQTSGLIINPQTAQNLLRERGIDTETAVVVYDAGSIVKSARVLWMLEVYGIRDVKILNGGFAAWQKSNLPIEQQVVTKLPSEYVVQINHNRIASKLTTQLATINPQQSIIDARPVAAYRGEKSTAQRFGHIPSAINIPVDHNFSSLDGSEENHLLRDTSELKALYDNIDKNGKVVIYCEAGAVSATNYLVLRELGYNVANYDASWREWGNDFSLPIEK
jgi:thiosulfate/3-mercaptopyruvate sulfurtransferase